MKAKCPYCENGCEKCDDGFTEARFASGNLFTRACKNKECGCENGGRIVETFPEESSGPCIMCNGETEWLFLGEI